MKNTKIEWIGNIPDNWDVKPISTCFKERNEKVSDYEWEPLSVTKQGIVKQLEAAAKSDAHDARKKVCKNDFVINSRSDRKQSCGISPYDGSVSLINIVLENTKLYPKFVNYLLNNYGFAEEFYRYGSGIVADLWSTNYQKMKKIMIPIPPKGKQKEIANFLDKKVTQIDNIIEKTKATIEDYKRYKQSYITQILTKGLNKNCNLKESNIDYIGKINTNFRVEDFKYLLKSNMQYGANESGQEFNEYLPRYVRITDIDESGILKEDNKLSLSEVAATNYILKDGDLLFARSGATVGKSFIYDEKYGRCAFAGYLIKASVNKKVIPKYVYYYTLSSIYEIWKNGIFIQATIQNIGAEKYMNMPLVFSSDINEQKEIVKHLDNKCLEIDNLISNKEKIIEELEQYKKSLIYEYVTGKKEVKSNNLLAKDDSKEIKINCKDNIFAQAILLCKIIEKLNKYNLGRVKAEKTLYLIEKDIGFNFNNSYLREKAGPLSEAIYKCESIISNKNRWIKVNKVKKHIEYEILPDFKKYNIYYKKYYLGYDSQIENIIDIIKNYSTDKAEMVATLYASWNDFIIKKEEISDFKIVKDVRENWNDTKKRFDENKWLAILEEMKQIGLTPKGNGNLTIVKEQ